jgi:hypothetical protein
VSDLWHYSNRTDWGCFKTRSVGEYLCLRGTIWREIRCRWQIILKWILGNRDSSRLWPVEGCCEHSNNLSVSIKCTEPLGKLTVLVAHQDELCIQLGSCMFLPLEFFCSLVICHLYFQAFLVLNILQILLIPSEWRNRRRCIRNAKLSLT